MMRLLISVTLLLFVISFYIAVNPKGIEAQNCGHYGEACCPISCFNDGGCASGQCNETLNQCQSTLMSDFTCFEGEKIDINPDPGWFQCECSSTGTEGSDLGGSCESDPECLRGVCRNRICTVETGCITIDASSFPSQSSAETFCTQANTTFCEYPKNWYRCCAGSESCFELKGEPVPLDWDMCRQAGPLQEVCEACMGSKEEPTGKIWTSVGCIENRTSSIARSFLQLAISIAGGIALLFMLFGAFTITTSRSDPERLQTGRNFFTSAIAGLFFIILSIIILRVIGVNLLQLPGFGS